MKAVSHASISVAGAPQAACTGAHPSSVVPSGKMCPASSVPAEPRALPAAPLLSAKETMPPSANETAPPLRECLTCARRPSASFLV